jgi:hypothetical protein
LYRVREGNGFAGYGEIWVWREAKFGVGWKVVLRSRRSVGL